MTETLPGIDSMLGTDMHPVVVQRLGQSEAMQLHSVSETRTRGLPEPIPGIDEDILHTTVDLWRNCPDDEHLQAHKKALRLQAVAAARVIQATAIDRLIGQREAGLVPVPQILPRVTRSVADLTQDAVISLDNDLRRHRIALSTVSGDDRVYSLSIA